MPSRLVGRFGLGGISVRAVRTGFDGNMPSTPSNTCRQVQGIKKPPADGLTGGFDNRGSVIKEQTFSYSNLPCLSSLADNPAQNPPHPLHCGYRPPDP